MGFIVARQKVYGLSRHGHRFFIDDSLSVGARVNLSQQQSHQVANVLRLQSGDQIVLFNGDGSEYRAVISEIDRSATAVDIVSTEVGFTLPGPPIHVALALIKSDRFEWALQKVTELGAERFIPMITEHSVISLRVDREARRRERWLKIAAEASEQSGRCTIPAIDPVVAFDDLICRIDATQTYLLWEEESTTALTAMRFDPDRPIVLLVGPEGGFSSAEIEMAKQAGVKTASLGHLTLRAETAAVAAAAMIVGRSISNTPY